LLSRGDRRVEKVDTNADDSTGSHPVQSGNAILPGATFHVSLIVNDLPDQQNQDTLALVIFTVCILGVAIGLGIYYKWKRLNRNDAK
jgi:hypothetical protein